MASIKCTDYFYNLFQRGAKNQKGQSLLIFSNVYTLALLGQSTVYNKFLKVIG